MEQIGGGAPTGEDEEWTVVDVDGGDKITERTESEIAQSDAGAAKEPRSPSSSPVTTSSSLSRTRTASRAATKSVPAPSSTAFRKFAEARGLSEDRLRFYHEGQKLNGDEAAVFVSVTRILSGVLG